MPQHIMVDLETWSTATNALVISIGAVKFDPQTFEINDSIVVNIDPVDSQRYDLHVDAATVMWWMSPEREVPRNAWLAADKLDLGSSLEGLHMWFHDGLGGADVPETFVWGNGAPFDNVILRNLYTTIGVEAPWSHWNDKCYRTTKGLQGAPKMDRGELVHHNPLDDAIAQVRHLKQICNDLEIEI